MKILVKKERVDRIKAECIIVPHFESDKTLCSLAKRLDKAMGGMVQAYLGEGDFRGELFEMALIHTNKVIPAKRILLCGCGKRVDWQIDKLRGIVAKAGRYLRQRNVKSMVVPVDLSELPDLSLSDTTQALVEGAVLGLYRFTEYKTRGREKIKPFESSTILYEEQGQKLDVRSGVRAGEIISDTVCKTRDLITQPSNRATPTYLAEKAKAMAGKLGLRLDVLDKGKMKKLGMGALLAVAQGSQEPPKLIVIEYVPSVKRRDTIALVGKAITFDSGGISLKPSKNMGRMKEDMAGGATVMGILEAVARLKLPVRVIGLIPAAENLPSGSAYRPGDVVTSLSGQTIEIISTDAEGRLILADALTYAQRYKPDAIIDLATLTGACIVALGDRVVGLMGNDDGFMEFVRNAADFTGEQAWPLPLWKEFEEHVKSDIADIKNAGGRGAGAIQGGIFLKRFIKKTPWVHLDIAGPSWADKERPYIPKGATGVGVRLIVQLLRDWKRGALKGSHQEKKISRNNSDGATV
jgi:leucyl aminopeptidase